MPACLSAYLLEGYLKKVAVQFS